MLGPWPFKTANIEVQPNFMTLNTESIYTTSIRTKSTSKQEQQTIEISTHMIFKIQNPLNGYGMSMAQNSKGLNPQYLL